MKPMSAAVKAALTVSRSDQAYRGYLVRTNAINGVCWIEKGGAFISYAKDTTEARSLVDMLESR